MWSELLLFFLPRSAHLKGRTTVWLRTEMWKENAVHMPGLFGRFSWFLCPFFCHSTLVCEFQAVSLREQKHSSPCEMGRTNIKKYKPSSGVKIGCLANAKFNNTEIFEAYTSFLHLAVHRVFINKTISHTPNLIETNKHHPLSTEETHEHRAVK